MGLKPDEMLGFLHLGLTKGLLKMLCLDFKNIFDLPKPSLASS